MSTLVYALTGTVFMLYMMGLIEVVDIYNVSLGWDLEQVLLGTTVFVGIVVIWALRLRK